MTADPNRATLPYEVLERAAIIEYDGKLPRKEAERLALAEWREQQRKEGVSR